MDEKTDRNDKRIRDEKKDASARRISMVKRSDQKRALRRSQAEQREAILEEKLSRARAAVEAKKEEIELAHKLAAELSRRRSKDLQIVSGFVGNHSSMKKYNYILVSLIPLFSCYTAFRGDSCPSTIRKIEFLCEL